MSPLLWPKRGGAGITSELRLFNRASLLEIPQGMELVEHQGRKTWMINPQRHNSRVHNRYNLSVPNVLFSNLGLPTVPQNQRDTLFYVAS